MRMRRWLAVLLIPLLLIAAGVLDGRDSGRAVTVEPIDGISTNAQTSGSGSALATLQAPDPAEVNSLAPVAAPPRGLDSTWFCAGGTAAKGAAGAVLVISNGGGRTRRATITTYETGHEPTSRSVELPARDTVRTRLGSATGSGAVAAVVDAAGGQVTVAQTVTGPDGTDTSPCAGRASPSWYFANGTTVRGARDLLYLFNPFPEDATANLTLETDAGLRQPPAFQGVVVKANSLHVVDVASAENRRKRIALTVTVTAGRLVAARAQSFDGTGDPSVGGASPVGLVVAPGVPRATTAVAFPFGYRSSDFGETLYLYNPGAARAEVEVAITLPDPQRNGVLPPQKLTVRSGSVVAMPMAKLRALPSGMAHSILVRSTNAVPIVAELWQHRTAGGEASVTASAGTPMLATTWFLPLVLTQDRTASLEVFNPGTEPVTVRATQLDGSPSPVPTLDGATIGARDRLRVSATEALGSHASSGIEITATGPVAVGGDALTTSGARVVLNRGVALAGTASVP